MNRKSKSVTRIPKKRSGRPEARSTGLLKQIEALKLSNDTLCLQNEAYKSQIDSIKTILSTLRTEIDAIKAQNEAIKSFITSIIKQSGAINSHSDAIKHYSDTDGQQSDALKLLIDALNLYSDTKQSQSNAINSLSDANKRQNDAIVTKSDSIKQQSDAIKSTDNVSIAENEAINKKNRLFEMLSGMIKALYPRHEFQTRFLERIPELFLLIREYEKLSVIGVCEESGMSRPTVQRILSLLRALELIEYKGSKRTGFYVLTEKGKGMVTNL